MSDERSLLERALAGDRRGSAQLVQLLAPVVQARVARILWRRRGPKSATRQDMLDLVQDVFAALFAENGRVLRGWDAERGLSLKNFVGLVAERHVLSALRSRRLNAWREDSDPAPFPAPIPEASSAEDALLSRELLTKLEERLRAVLSPLGLELFHRLYVDEQTVEDVQAQCGLSADAVYQWRTRLRKQAQSVLIELERDQLAGGRSSTNLREVS